MVQTKKLVTRQRYVCVTRDRWTRVYGINCFEGRISPEPIRNPLTNKLISGPLIIKTDAGPGRLSKETSSIEFREQMAAKVQTGMREKRPLCCI
jgi:hypothetical protein